MTLLQSIQQDLQEDLSGKVQKLPSDILKYYDLASGLMIDGVGSDYIKWNMASFMGRVNYGYMGRYLLTLSARYDGSSRLAEGHKWVLFPSAALAWRISDEPFMKDLLWLDNLKLRVVTERPVILRSARIRPRGNWLCDIMCSIMGVRNI